MCAVLTGTENPRRYWSDLKRKLKAEGSEVYEDIVQLKMNAPNGKMRLTDVATTEEQLLRLIQSIPSSKAEPFKLWLAEVGLVLAAIAERGSQGRHDFAVHFTLNGAVRLRYLAAGGGESIPLSRPLSMCGKGGGKG